MSDALNQVNQAQSLIKRRGMFITLEGGEGVGKSTNLALMMDCLERAGIDYIQTREPGGTEFGEALRELLLGDISQGICADAELLSIFAARAQHIHAVILPALNAGQWVISDRFTDATFAYQGGGRNMSFERVATIEQWVQQGLQPDMTLLLDAPIEVGMQRAAQRAELDRFEQESMDFFRAVRAAYLQRAKADSQRFALIDAAQPLEAVQTDIQELMHLVIQQWQTQGRIVPNQAADKVLGGRLTDAEISR